MRQITKGREPRSLTRYRLGAAGNYADYRQKDELRDALATEQRYLCCYCMRGIDADWNKMKIEHWRSQAGHDGEQLNYQNLLAGCMGGQGKPYDEQHCDTRKGDKNLKWNPANPVHRIETRVFYDIEGRIHSRDAKFNTELDEVLNLNHDAIRNNRKSAITAMAEWWKSERNRRRKRPPRTVIEQEIGKRIHGRKLAPYSQVAVWFLRQRLAEKAK